MATESDLTHPLSWPDTLERLRDFQSRLLLAIHGLGETDLGRPERDGRWSIRDVVAHLGDFEMVTGLRIRSALADDRPAYMRLNQERFVAALHQHDSFAELIEALGFHRRANVALVERLSDAELAREGEHPEYGTLTIRQTMARVQRHQEKHLRQIEAIKSTLGLHASDS
ncbi:MAG TPA: DinB family protein, partial [Thermoanaerobaculia bacterium]